MKGNVSFGKVELYVYRSYALLMGLYYLAKHIKYELMHW